MDNLLPEGAANHPLAPYNDNGLRSHNPGKPSKLSATEAGRMLGEAIDRMVAAGMKPVVLNGQ